MHGVPGKLMARTARARGWLFAAFRATILVGVSYVILYPLILMLSTAFMDPSDIYDVTVAWIPRRFTWDNVRAVAHVMEYGKSLGNSFALALVVSVLQAASCSLVGYGFARFPFPGRNALFALVILTLIVPPQTIMLPLFLHFRFFDFLGIIERMRGRPGILDSFWPFILQSATAMGFKNGLYILIFRQFFRGMPKSLEEAALMDGAGIPRVFIRIFAPNALPAAATVFLFSFVWQWNDDYFVSLFLENVKVLPLALSGLAARASQSVGQGVSLDPYYVSLLNNTGSLLLLAPLLAVYAAAQRYFVESIERTGLVD